MVWSISLRPDVASRIIIRPYVTEKTFDSIERDNKLCFLVDDAANKNSIRHALHALYDVNTLTVKTARTIQGKKAYVRFVPEDSASDLASKLGVL